LIASGAEFLYIFVGLIVSDYAFSASVLHLEYQFVFRMLAYLLLVGFIKELKNDDQNCTLDELKGIGWNIWGVLFGFAVFGSLGVSLITSKQLILNSLTKANFFELGYLVVFINIVQAFYLISVFETVVIKKSDKKLSKITNELSVKLLTLAGIAVFLLPQIYLFIPNFFSKIDSFHLGLEVDFSGIRAVFAVLFGFISLVIFLYSFEYIKKYKKFYYGAFAVLSIALIEIVLSRSFESFYLFWELMTISSYLLIMHSRSESSVKAGKLYFLMCISGAYLLQLAFSHFYSVGIDNFLAVGSISLNIAVLLFFGFGVKAGIVPLHSWLPVAHPIAPSSISAPLSGILTKAGIFGIVTIIYIFGFKSLAFSYLLIGLGLLTLFYGEIKTLYEKDIKKLFAYSTIGQIGEIVIVLGLMSPVALNGALYHIVNHAIVKDLLFLSAGLLILSAGSKNLDNLQGIGKKLPVLAFPMGMGIFAISAFPPFGNFNSKFLMIYASMAQNNYIAAFGMIIGSIIGFIAMLRVFRVVFLLSPKNEFKNIGGLKLYVVYFLAFISLLLGIFGNSVIEYINSAVCQTLFIKTQMPTFQLSIPLSVIIMGIGSVIVFFFAKTTKSAGILSALFSFLSLLEIFTHKIDFNSFFVILVLFMAILNFIYAAKYMDHSHKPYRFFANFILMIVGIVGVILSNNIYSMFFYWEIMGGWALYMALIHEEDAYSVKEATKYLIYNFAGAGILMIGLSIIFNYGDNFDLLRSVSFNNEIIFAIILLTIGFLAKASQFPIRIDYQMHPKPAPTPISGYISSVMLKTGPFMMVKVFYFITSAIALAKLSSFSSIEALGHFSSVIGVITILMGAGFGLLTNSMKRLLIFLTVAEIGYIIAAISLITNEGFAGGMLHLVNHMFFKDLLFLSAGAIFYKTGIDNLNELGGIARKMPITFAVFMVAVFSTAGVPMFSGFVSKWMIYHALMAKGYIFLAIFTLLGSVMILLVFVKFMHSAYLGKMDSSFEEIEKVDWYMAMPMIILAGLNIIMGVFPYIILSPINRFLEELGFESVDITTFSISMGGDILNPFSLAFYLLTALMIGYLMFLYNKNTRKTHIFLSGVRDLSKKELHIKSKSFYESVTELIYKIVKIFKVIFGIKGGYIER